MTTYLTTIQDKLEQTRADIDIFALALENLSGLGLTTECKNDLKTAIRLLESAQEKIHEAERLIGDTAGRTA